MSSSVDDIAIHLNSVRRWTIILSVNTLPRTLNHGPPAAIKNVGQQHFSRIDFLYSEVKYGIKVDAIKIHHLVVPRASHAETHLTIRVTATFPNLSLVGFIVCFITFNVYSGPWCVGKPLPGGDSGSRTPPPYLLLPIPVTPMGHVTHAIAYCWTEMLCGGPQALRYPTFLVLPYMPIIEAAVFSGLLSHLVIVHVNGPASKRGPPVVLFGVEWCGLVVWSMGVSGGIVNAGRYNGGKGGGHTDLFLGLV
ncbi:hypothetical protein F5888DRAFT_1632914 [Russula emetica]|nr:hypothetical protein F5888DRAFT_1632914 [Russula emetica]